MRSAFNTHELAEECGVRLRAPKAHTGPTNRPGECFCKATVKWIGTTYGPDHLRLVFRLMTGTKQNAACLYGDVLKAVARVLVKDVHLVSRATLVSDFDTMDLSAIRKQAQAMQCGVPLNERIGVLISLRLNHEALAAGDQAL